VSSISRCGRSPGRRRLRDPHSSRASAIQEEEARNRQPADCPRKPGKVITNSPPPETVRHCRDEHASDAPPGLSKSQANRILRAGRQSELPSRCDHVSELLRGEPSALRFSGACGTALTDIRGARLDARRSPSHHSGVAELPAGTVTLLFTDVEGSTRDTRCSSSSARSASVFRRSA
jgi:hypothetical protein